MTQEEKAKAYDKALEKARQLCTYPTTQPFIGDLQDLFPELRESEDERIRKWCISHFSKCFRVMKDAEYQEYLNNKVIPWLEKQGKNSPILSSSSNIGEVEQNPAWTKADENTLLDTINVLRSCGRTSTDRKLWLLSLKKRVQSQPKQEWSEEDKRNLQGIIDEIEANKNQAPDYDIATYDRFLSWLKSLRPQSKTYYWTENEIKFAISDYIRGVESYEKMVEKLRCLKPQSQWKPSDEQMDTLETAVSSLQSTALESLYNDLQKLK